MLYRIALASLTLTVASIVLSSTVRAAEPFVERVFPGPVGIQLKSNNNSSENLDQVKEIGFTWVRRGFIWESIEKTAGEYDFSAYDRLMKDCEDRGLGVIACMAFSNKLYGPAYEDKGREGYAKFAATLAKHYAGKRIMFEIWNEPNTQTFWGKHGKHNSEPFAEQYVSLVKATVPAMKKANPDCVVMAGSVSGLWSASYQWMQFCFDKGVLKTGIDVWSVHPYSVKSPEDYLEAYGKMRSMMAAAGASHTFPVINSERGFPIGKAEGYAGGDPKLAKEYQAWHFVRQQLIDVLADTKLTIWYEWSGKDGFGMMEAAGPTPSATAAKVMIEQLKGYTLDDRIKLSSDRDFALRFTNKTGGMKIVAWTSPPPGQAADKAVTHDVTIPVVGGMGSLVTYGIYGDEGKAITEQGNINLTLTGAPQYVIVK